jgi:hypothetical protein
MTTHETGTREARAIGAVSSDGVALIALKSEVRLTHLAKVSRLWCRPQACNATGT